MNKIFLSLIFDGENAMVMAATKSQTGVIMPLATESEKIPVNSNKSGVVEVNDDTCMAVGKLCKTILNKIEGENEVTGIYLGIMPRSMHGEAIEIHKEFQGKHRITEHDIENMDKEVVDKITNTVVAVYNNGFERDGLETLNVRNELADSLTRKSLALVVSPRHLPDYKKLMPNEVKLRKIVPTPVAIAHIVTDEEQRVNGVMSFHIACQSSGLTYMRNDMVMGCAVVPFGFDHILKDMSLGEIPLEKIRSFVTGSKMTYKCAQGTTIKFSNDGHAFSLSDSIAAFNARIREIFSLAHERILATLNLDELKTTVLVSSSLINTQEFAEALSGLLEQDCVLANSSNVLNEGQKFAANKYIPLIGIINEATENCIEERTYEIDTTPKTKKSPGDDEEPWDGEEPDDEEDSKTHKKTWLEKIKDQTIIFNDEQ
ncbi:MAG: hypothetical protein MJ002_08685 [Paludibacteraceae bacterium]|nr:hypothetical protein [Paludibacteraceae bacterium]